MARIRQGLFFTLLASLMLSHVHASEFSADLVQTGPKGQSSQGRMFVSEGKVRTEMQREGRSIVQIADESAETAWIVFPAEKSYLVQKGHFASVTGGAGTDSGNPCNALPGAQCKQLGSETVNGREAVKWEVSMTLQGQSVTAQQWIDAEYKLPLRQQLPQNQVIESRFAGRETLNGREVEKVEVSFLRDGKVLRQSSQWFDPKLRLVLRQEYPGGGVSEIKNIKEGPQDASLFELPKGYQEMKMPQNPASSSAPQR